MSEKDVFATENVISEIKQAAALSSGILGLKESFVQLNEIIGLSMTK